MNAPVCMVCDDSGVVPGSEVFNAALCRCSAGKAFEEGGANGVLRMSAAHAADFVVGPLRFSEQGMQYQGALILDAGKAYRTLMAVLHGQEPNRDDRPPRFPAQDIATQDLGLMVARLAHALALHSPNDHLLRNAETILTRHGMQAGVDYKALPTAASVSWPDPRGGAPFSIERRDDPHNMSNRHNPLNQGRRRSDKE